MTREELKEHCEKQIEQCKLWANYIGEEPHGKIYEEHKLILELLEQEPFINKPCIAQSICHEDKIKVLDKIIAEISEWYWQADKKRLAKDPCVVDAMIDLFIRTIDKYKSESEN